MATQPSTSSNGDGRFGASPASRASWCGQLRIDDFCVPVKAYSAIATPPDTPLHQLHSLCGRRIEYRKWCPKHGAVPPEEIVKGYPYQPDRHIQISAAELERLQPNDDKTIHLRHFVEPDLVNLVLLAGRSLYLAPANPAARRPYAMLLQVLRQSRTWGLGQVVFSTKQQTILMRPEDQVLLLHTLHHPALRRALPNIDASVLEIPAKEVASLRRIIDSASGDIAWPALRDDSDSRLAELVAGKVNPPKRRRTSGGNGKTRRTTAPSNSQAGSQAKSRKPSGKKRKQQQAA